MRGFFVIPTLGRHNICLRGSSEILTSLATPPRFRDSDLRLPHCPCGHWSRTGRSHHYWRFGLHPRGTFPRISLRSMPRISDTSTPMRARRAGLRRNHLSRLPRDPGFFLESGSPQPLSEWLSDTRRPPSLCNATQQAGPGSPCSRQLLSGRLHRQPLSRTSA